MWRLCWSGEVHTGFGGAGQPEGKRLLGRPIHRWEDNIKTEIQEQDVYVDWTELAQLRDRWQEVVNTVINLWVPQNLRNLLTG